LILSFAIDGGGSLERGGLAMCFIVDPFRLTIFPTG